MNLRDMHYITALTEHGSFGRAAAACHVSQPTLSMQIQKLEVELGVTLFERNRKRIMLTNAGRRIVDCARVMVGQEKHIRDIAHAVRDPHIGEFRLGAIPTLASYIFPSFVAGLNKAFPRLHMLLVEEKTENLLERLKDGKIDAAMLALPVHDSSLVAEPLFDDEFLLAVNAKHELAKRKSVTMKDLQDRRLLLLDEGHCLRDQALSVCRTHGAQEQTGFRATSLETLRLMVAAQDDLITLMPAVAKIENSQLRYIPFAGTPPSREIGLVWRKTATRMPLMNEMAVVLKTLK